MIKSVLKSGNLSKNLHTGDSGGVAGEDRATPRGKSILHGRGFDRDAGQMMIFSRSKNDPGNP